MTKEPIMINDVDVSECEFFSSGLGYCTIGLLANDGTHICECEQNCHYKLYKRKEQKCEELKETLIEIQQDLEFATYCESQECGCDDPNECLECTKKQILQKISEVEDDR